MVVLSKSYLSSTAEMVPYTCCGFGQEDLLKLPVCTEDKSSQLRLIYNRVFANVRGLESLGINATQYGSFLIPVIMSKLPAEVRLQIARVSVKDVWEVEELLTYQS